MSFKKREREREREREGYLKGKKPVVLRFVFFKKLQVLGIEFFKYIFQILHFFILYSSLLVTTQLPQSFDVF